MDNVVEFAGGRSRKTFPIELMPEIIADQYDPTFLFFEHAAKTGQAGLAIIDPADTSRRKPVAFNRVFANRLGKMYQIALGFNIFRKLMAVHEGDITRIYSQPKNNEQSDLAMTTANRVLDASVDPNRIFLTAYQRWDRVFHQEDGSEHDEFTLRGMRKDTDAVAEKERRKGKTEYSPEELQGIVKRVFHAADEVYDEQNRPETERLMAKIFGAVKRTKR